jgi:DNA-binding XRE family transcriptional regulator
MLGWTINPHRLRELREEAQLTPAALAALAGCHRNTYNNLEREQQPGPELTWRIVNALSERLGRKITVADIATPRERARRKTTAGSSSGSAA